MLDKISRPDDPLVPAGTAVAHVRYEPVPPGVDRRRGPAYRQAVHALAAPFVGSSLVFPGRFSAAVERLIVDPRAAGLNPAYPRWYFGSALQMEINPARLRRRISDFVNDGVRVRWVGESFLDGADWQSALGSLMRSPIHREMGELIAADLDFRAIRAYRLQLRAAEAGTPVRRNGIVLAGPAEIEAYYRYCVGLINSIRRHGVVRRRPLDAIRSPDPEHRYARPPALDRAERDVGIAINENGKIVRHLGGKHRTAIAQALGLPSIPVEVRFVHVRWLARQIERTGLPAHLALPQALGALRADFLRPRNRRPG